jgi:4-amino-4-deoxy-L-arabinose transferase-like glycosyltransferase
MTREDLSPPAPLPLAGRGEKSGAQAWRLASIALFAIAFLALAAQFAVYVDYAGSLFRFPYDYDQGEGFELYDTVLQAQGQWPYRDSQVFPFYTSIYPPLFHLITVPLVWAFGPQLWTGRLVSFTASLVAAGAIAYGVARAGGNRAIGALAGLTFLASNYTFHIGPLFRQHMTMVTFETLGVVCLAQLDFRPEAGWLRRPAFWLGLACLLAAGYTKQLALATVIAGLAFLFVRGPRRALLAGLGLALVAGALFWLINHATGGYWYLSIIRANINSFDWAQALQLYRQWTELHLLIVAVAGVSLVYEIYLGRLSAYGLWFALAVADAALSGKFGAGESYFVTATAAACALSGIALARLWARAPAWPRYGAQAAAALALAIPLLYLAQARLTLHLPTTGPIYGPAASLLGVASDSGYYDSQGYTQLGPHPTAADIAAGDQIAALARAAPGPVFSEEAALMFRAGKPVVTNPFPQLVMYQAGLFNPAHEIAMIQQQAFGLVILRAQFYPPPVLQALGANYKPLTEIKMNGFLYRILEPRGKQ